jgi:hypothetical protein
VDDARLMERGRNSHCYPFNCEMVMVTLEHGGRLHFGHGIVSLSIRISSDLEKDDD